MTVEAVAILIALLSHFAGLAALVAMIARTDGVDWSSLWPKDDDDSGGGPGGSEYGPNDDGPSGELGLRLPLDDGDPGSTRLREPHPARIPHRTRRGPAEVPTRRPPVPHGTPR